MAGQEDCILVTTWHKDMEEYTPKTRKNVELIMKSTVINNYTNNMGGVGIADHSHQHTALEGS
jgi:molybdopterin-biosynthesis enzyme MoeA-like protein